MCGAPLGAGYNFCNMCGASQLYYAPPQYTQPAPMYMQYPVPPAVKKSNTGYIIGIIVGAVILLTGIILAIVLLGGANSHIQGEWALQNTNDEDYSYITNFRMEFRNDGSGTFSYFFMGEPYRYDFDWRLENKSLYFDGEEHIITKLDANTLEYEYYRDGIILWWKFTKR